MRHRFGAAAAALVAAAPFSSPVFAQAFDIDQPELKKGETEIKDVSTFHWRYPRGTTDRTRSSHDWGYGYAFSDYFKMAGHIGFDDISSSGWQVSTLSAQAQAIVVKIPEAGGFGLGINGILTGSVHDDTTNSVLVGPMMAWKADKFTFAVNPYFQRTFGRNHTEGMDFVYGWQGKVEVRENLSIGIEGFGAIENISNPPSRDEQDHRIGPGIYASFDLGGGRTLNIDNALLFGLTDATPDIAWRATAGVTF